MINIMQSLTRWEIFLKMRQKQTLADLDRVPLLSSRDARLSAHNVTRVAIIIMSSWSPNRVWLRKLRTLFLREDYESFNRTLIRLATLPCSYRSNSKPMAADASIRGQSEKIQPHGPVLGWITCIYFLSTICCNRSSFTSRISHRLRSPRVKSNTVVYDLSARLAIQMFFFCGPGERKSSTAIGSLCTHSVHRSHRMGKPASFG